MLTNAIRLNVYPIDFSIYATCPRAIEPDAHDQSVSLFNEKKKNI